MAGPIEAHAFRDDPVSAGAVREISVGTRTLMAMSDGFLRIPRTFIGTEASPTAAYDALEDQYGDVRLPIGCFLLPGEKTTLIDAGFGPVDYNGLGLMMGGRLLDHLLRCRVRPGDINAVVLSHLHSDHTGWLADANGEPVFGNAIVHVGREDWEYFMESGGEPAPPAHITHALQFLAGRGQLELIDGEKQVAPGLTRLPAPGHTPGHSLYVVHQARERVLLFGDALYCPHQLTNADWAAANDVDPVLARRTRGRYLRDLEEHGGNALGCHFPELIAARVLARPGTVDPWR